MCLFNPYNKLKTNNWRKLNEKSKIKTSQKILNKLCKNYGLKPINAQISTNLASNIWGVYHSGQNEYIEINKQLIIKPDKQFFLLSTLFHEFRHAYQQNIIKKQTSFLNFHARKWKRNYEGYINSTNYEIYKIQPIEKDAQLFAYKKLKHKSFKYRKEPNFKEHLQELKQAMDNAEKDAKQKYGIFYKFKMRSQMRKKQKENNLKVIQKKK